MKLAVFTSQFNPEVTQGLLNGVREIFREQSIPDSAVDYFPAPGAFELPLLAQQAAKSGRYSGVICLGCVIKGDTAHFEFISLGTAIGLQLAMQSTGVPISFGVLTTYTDEQAIARSRPDPHNKGREAALACLGSLRILKEMR
jgi:6,7-dimethyl-8-ribityllumazine synthase